MFKYFYPIILTFTFCCQPRAEAFEQPTGTPIKAVSARICVPEGTWGEASHLVIVLDFPNPVTPDLRSVDTSSIIKNPLTEPWERNYLFGIQSSAINIIKVAVFPLTADTIALVAHITTGTALSIDSLKELAAPMAEGEAPLEQDTQNVVFVLQPGNSFEVTQSSYALDMRVGGVGDNYEGES